MEQGEGAPGVDERSPDPWATPVHTDHTPAETGHVDHDSRTAPARTPGPGAESRHGADPITAPIPILSAPTPTTEHGSAAPAASTGLATTGTTGTAAPAKSPWTLTDAFVGLGVTLLLTLVVGAIARISGFDGGPALLVLGGLPIWVGLVGTTIWACRRHGTGNLALDLGLRLRWSDLWVGFLVGIGLRLAIGIWATVVTRVTRQTPESNIPELGGSGLGTGAWLVINVLAIVLVGPMVEEIFFRGVTLRSALASLLRRSGRPRLADPRRRASYAALISGGLFSLLHLGEVVTLTSTLVLIPGLFFAGWVMARLTLWRQRLGPAIVTHIVFNGTAIAVLLAVR